MSFKPIANPNHYATTPSTRTRETILGACLIEKEGMALVDELLKPEMFYVTRHQLIYAALQAMFHAGTNIDILTATEELRKRGKLDDAGGPFYITQLSSRVASSAHLEYHARIVHQKYIRREMIVGFSKLLTLSDDETIDLTDTLRMLTTCWTGLKEPADTTGNYGIWTL